MAYGSNNEIDVIENFFLPVRAELARLGTHAKEMNRRDVVEIGCTVRSGFSCGRTSDNGRIQISALSVALTVLWISRGMVRGKFTQAQLHPKNWVYQTGGYRCGMRRSAPTQDLWCTTVRLALQQISGHSPEGQYCYRLRRGSRRRFIGDSQLHINRGTCHPRVKSQGV